VGVVNIDAHLDVRPLLDGRGHSGSPFRQMMEHAEFPLPGRNYVCIGAQPSAVAREHLEFVRRQGGVVRWSDKVWADLDFAFSQEDDRLRQESLPAYVTLDADVVIAADVPGVSAPNSAGHYGAELLRLAEMIGRSPAVSSFDLVEINPRLDRDGQSARWAALVVWNFLVGLTHRRR
jgi:formiminoglutamase